MRMNKFSCIFMTIILLSACGDGKDKFEGRSDISQDHSIVQPAVQPSSVDGLCPPPSLIDHSHHDKPNHSLNKDSDITEIFQKITTEQYSLFVPKTWNVENDPAGVIFKLSNKEIGRIDTHSSPKDETLPLYLLSHVDLLQCQELVGFPSRGVEYLMHMTYPAGDVSLQEEYDLIQYNLIYEEEKKYQVYVLSFDRREVTENTAAELTKTFVLKKEKVK